MSIVSNSFMLLTLIALVVYYVIPTRLRWAVLLVFSWVYYLLSGPRMAAFLLFSIVLTYGAARAVKRFEGMAKWILPAALIANFAVLGYLKYSCFIIDTAGQIFGTGWRGTQLLLPIGISFYTFQSTGYLLDVYWGSYEPEKNFLHYALFISFYPQLMQGPIGRYDQLSSQFLSPKTDGLQQIVRGAERVLWGLFKKIVIADWAAVYVAAVFDSGDLNPHLALFGAILYTVQLYMDFSGAMDIVIGISEMFGITLEENFSQPFFSRTVAEFWRHWHITLGKWMHDYLLFPVMQNSRLMLKLQKKLRKKYGRKAHIAKALPMAVAELIVFAAVGIWHGAGWNYLLYGLFNGVIVASGVLLENVFASWKSFLHISDDTKWFHGFQLIRTWMLTLMWMVMIRAANMGRALSMIRHFISMPSLSDLLAIPAGRLGVSYSPAALLTVLGGCILVLIISLLKQRGCRVRESIAGLPLAAAAALYLILFVCIGFFGSAAASGGFIYAQF